MCLLLMLVMVTNSVKVSGQEFLRKALYSSDEKEAANKEFWDRLYHNAFSNTKTKYDVLNGDRVCLTCPIDRAMYNNLYHEVAGAYNTSSNQVPPRVSITWTSQLPNDHTIFYCRNNMRVNQMPAVQNYDTDGYSEQQRGRGSGEVDFTCENNQLCLRNVRYHYPDSYQCLIRSYVQSVKLNVIGKSKMSASSSDSISQTPSSTKSFVITSSQRSASSAIAGSLDSSLLASIRSKRSEDSLFQPNFSNINLSRRTSLSLIV